MLKGRALVTAMCAGQIGNLLPHVVVPAVMTQHLIPAWGLTASEAGLMASSFAIGYMLAVPVLATLTDRIDARLILLVPPYHFLKLIYKMLFKVFKQEMIRVDGLFIDELRIVRQCSFEYVLDRLVGH